MHSQHGPGHWVKKETKQLAEILVKSTIQPLHDHLAEDQSPTDGASVVDMDSISIVPQVLQKGVIMTKILAKQQKRLIFQLDPDEGNILYKSTKYGTGKYYIYIYLNS